MYEAWITFIVAGLFIFSIIYGLKITDRHFNKIR